MQRWIVIAGLAALILGACAVGGYWQYRQNITQQVWVPVGLNPELPPDKQQELAERIKEKLLEGTLIEDAAKDVGLAAKLDFPTSVEAGADVRKRLFVQIGETQTPEGKMVPSLNVGINAQRKSFKAMGEMATRMMDDVWKILGIKKPEAAPAF